MILQNRIDSFIFYIEYQYKVYNFLKLGEDIIVEYIFNINSKDFLFKFKNVEYMLNYIFELSDVKNIEKLQMY